MSDGPTKLFVGAAGSTGTITARRWTHDGWIEGQTQVSIANGEVLGAVNALGNLDLRTFEVNIAPVDIPQEVFGKPAQLTDVRVKLPQPLTGELAWTSEDDATARLTLVLDLDWAIAINGSQTPLGTQRLPPVPVDFAITGGGDHIDASIDLHAAGELWSWAGLLEVTAIELDLAASTVD
ncbi:MAG: hypothetical protein HOV81_33475 [Kofleriaceae bacterium]|nr:hypothetical protein [Kofleriaceae bacterium]